MRLILETTLTDGTPVRLDAFTLVVNAHGGLLEMSLKVSKGHKLLLSNPVLGTREPCHVVATRGSQDGSFRVAFEFDKHASQFWSLAFPPGDWVVPSN